MLGFRAGCGVVRREMANQGRNLVSVQQPKGKGLDEYDYENNSYPTGRARGKENNSRRSKSLGI